MHFKIKNNQSGSILFQIMLSLSIITGITFSIYNSSQSNDDLIKKARIVSAMNLAYYTFKNSLQNPQNYYCPTGSTISCTANQIKLSPSFINDFNNSLKLTPDLKIIETISFNSDGLKTFNGKIIYDGRIKIKDIEIIETISDSVLGSSSSLCNDLTQPLFVGFSSSGTINCRALPNGAANPCPAGSYVASVDSKTLKVECKTLSSVNECADPDQYMTDFIWQGSGKAHFSCKNRMNPFEYFKFANIEKIQFESNPVYGSCGSAQSVATAIYPLLNLCSNGLPVGTDLAGWDGEFNWNCVGSSGAVDVCTAPTTAYIDGSCGDAHGVDVENYPASLHCEYSKYVVVDTVGNDGTFNWRCEGANGGINQNCSANKVILTPLNGECGDAHNLATQIYPTVNHCKSGNTVAIDSVGTDGFFNWTCSGILGGAAANCQAEKKTNEVDFGDLGSFYKSEGNASGAADLRFRINFKGPRATIFDTVTGLKTVTREFVVESVIGVSGAGQLSQGSTIYPNGKHIGKYTVSGPEADDAYIVQFSYTNEYANWRHTSANAYNATATTAPFQTLEGCSNIGPSGCAVNGDYSNALFAEWTYTNGGGSRGVLIISFRNTRTNSISSKTIQFENKAYGASSPTNKISGLCPVWSSCKPTDPKPNSTAGCRCSAESACYGSFSGFSWGPGGLGDHENLVCHNGQWKIFCEPTNTKYSCAAIGK